MKLEIILRKKNKKIKKKRPKNHYNICLHSLPKSLKIIQLRLQTGIQSIKIY